MRILKLFSIFKLFHCKTVNSLINGKFFVQSSQIIKDIKIIYVYFVHNKIYPFWQFASRVQKQLKWQRKCKIYIALYYIDDTIMAVCLS